MPRFPKRFFKRKPVISSDVQKSTSESDSTESEFSDSHTDSEFELSNCKQLNETKDNISYLTKQISLIKFDNQTLDKEIINKMTLPNASSNTSLSIEFLLKNLNCFDGTPGTLNRWLKQGNVIINNSPQEHKETITILVRNKIIGKANEILISLGDSSHWQTIHEHLN